MRQALAARDLRDMTGPVRAAHLFTHVALALVACHCGAAAPQRQTTPAPGPLELDASLPADGFTATARSALSATVDQACWLVVVGSAVPRPEGGTQVFLRTPTGREEGFVECGADPFPDVLIGRSRFLIATLAGDTGYIVASSFGAYGASYSPVFAFGRDPVAVVLGDPEPDAVTLIELVPIGYDTTDNELFEVVADGVGIEGAAPDLRLAMDALMQQPAIGACADGSGGVMSAELAIRADGSVGVASFWSSTLASPEIDACVIDALRAARLPPTGHPWMFTIAIEPEIFRSRSARSN